MWAESIYHLFVWSGRTRNRRGLASPDELLAERIGQGLNAIIVSKKTAYAGREFLVDYKERREMVELACKPKGYRRRSALL
jgi:hypothetical protein